MKKAYQISNEGYFISTVLCQRSPLEKDVFLIPLGAIEKEPPQYSKNEIPYWNGSEWQIKPNYSKKIYFSKQNRSQKTFEIGEDFDASYTEVPPLENEEFQKWNELGYWEKDNEAEEEYLLQVEISKTLKRQKNIRQLLLESDYIELPSFLERKGQDVYNLWMSYREKLRLAYHDLNIEIPNPPSD